MKVGLLTAYYGEDYKQLADVVLPNMRDYCIKNKYTFLPFKLEPNEAQYGFSKIEKCLLALTLDNIDVLLCTDLDVLITNFNTRIESFIDEEHDFFVCKDVNGINTGTFIIRNTDWSKSLLAFILNCRNTLDNEQNAIDWFYKKEPSHKIKILPHPSINSYLYSEYTPNWGVIGDRKIEKPTHEEGNWQKGDFLLHMPGQSLSKRIEIINRIKEEVIQ